MHARAASGDLLCTPRAALTVGTGPVGVRIASRLARAAEGMCSEICPNANSFQRVHEEKADGGPEKVEKSKRREKTAGEQKTGIHRARQRDRAR